MKTFLISVIAISILYSLNAAAGVSSGGSSVFVFVDETGGIGQGVLQDARSSDNDVEAIGCGVKRDESGLAFYPETHPLYPHGRSFCYATDADGVEAFCFIESESLAESLNAMTQFSWISFQYGEDDVCVRVDVSNHSRTLPLVKLNKEK